MKYTEIRLRDLRVRKSINVYNKIGKCISSAGKRAAKNGTGE